MKYSFSFLLLITSIAIFSCKKKKDTTPAAEVQRLPSSFTGMKTWRYSYRYLVSHSPDRDTTVTGTTSFAVSYLKGDTVMIEGDKLWFKSSGPDSSSRLVLNYEASSFPTYIYSASFVHTPTGDTIYYSVNVSGFGVSYSDNYVTP